MIPGAKVGLIIGKGGETIKMLQESSGAKMIVIQDGPNSQENEKPLRISGETAKVEVNSIRNTIIIEINIYILSIWF
jgi:far upstream element-binding protein